MKRKLIYVSTPPKSVNQKGEAGIVTGVVSGRGELGRVPENMPGSASRGWRETDAAKGDFRMFSRRFTG